MTHFDCGCATYPATDDDYCGAHWIVWCHEDVEREPNEPECPPCRLSRLRSVSLSPKATPTRRGAA